MTILSDLNTLYRLDMLSSMNIGLIASKIICSYLCSLKINQIRCLDMFYKGKDEICENVKKRLILD